MEITGGKRGRKRVYDAEKTRAIILDAASAVFAEHGFDGASVDAIAEKAGYNKSLLFQYFGDKLSLYTQVLNRADRQMGEHMNHLFSSLPDEELLVSDVNRFRDFLISMCGAMYDFLVENSQAMHLFNWEQAEGWQTFTQLASQFEPDDLARFEALFQQTRNAGLLRPDLDSIVAVVLIQQVCWSSLAALPLYQSLFAGRDMPPAAVLAHLREQVVAFLIAGIMGDSEGQNGPSIERKEL